MGYLHSRKPPCFFQHLTWTSCMSTAWLEKKIDSKLQPARLGKRHVVSIPRYGSKMGLVVEKNILQSMVNTNWRWLILRITVYTIPCFIFYKSVCVWHCMPQIAYLKGANDDQILKLGVPKISHKAIRTTQRPTTLKHK